MNSLKLNSLAENRIVNKKLDSVKGGQTTKGAFMVGGMSGGKSCGCPCTCGCNYAGNGGSSTADNNAANNKGGLKS